MVIDLDPGDGVDWDAVLEAAFRLREMMRAEGFSPWPKLTGGKGIHLMAPLDPPIPHDEAHRTARRIVSELAARFPGSYILSAQANRRGRLFLDYLRNGRGTTAIGTYFRRGYGRVFQLQRPLHGLALRRDFAPMLSPCTVPSAPGATMRTPGQDGGNECCLWTRASSAPTDYPGHASRWQN
jgi:bifunctional non-homologous end joining protein LigD